MTSALRRHLLAALGASLLPEAFAQPAPSGKVWRIGIVPGGLYAPRKYQWEVFFARMQALGYAEGRNIRYEIRAPEAEGASFDEPITALARLNVDVIVATGNKAATAARRVAPNIAMVLSPAQDAVGAGLVPSLGRPGGNVTGISIQMEESTGKRMQLLRDMAPKATRMAILWRPATQLQLDAAREAAPQLKLDLLPIEVSSPEAVPAAFESAVKARAQSMIVTMDPFFFGQSREIGDLSLKHRLPSIWALAVGAANGALMAYGPSDTDYYRIAAEFVDKILRGAKPADLPIQQPTKWELVINLQTARALGMVVPRALLQQADRLIE